MKNIVLIINIALVLLSCGGKNEEKKVETVKQLPENNLILTDEQYKNAGIEIGKLTTQIISPVLKLNGKIEVPPQGMVTVSIPMGGYLKSTRLIPGMQVNRGQVIAVIEDIQYIQLQQDYLTSKANLTLAQSEYNRQRELNQSKATSDKLFEQARANYQTQQVLKRSFEEKLKLIGLNPNNISTRNITKSISVFSPISGYVSAVHVNVGKYVNPSDVLFELINPANIHLALTVFEKDVNKLAIGQKVFAYTNANPEKKHLLEIALINQNISGQNSAEVHCRFKEPNRTLLPGMFMNADIELSTNQASALPSDAIVRFENKHYVFVEKGDRHFEKTEVQIGDSENGYTEILNSDALKNKNFVIKGAYVLLMALKNESEE